MKAHPVHLAKARALYRLRDTHRDEFDALYREERAKLGLGAEPRGPAKCGTRSGYNRHRRNGEDACRACKDAEAAARRAYKAARDGDAA